ncbi:Digestive organ expansion factor [Schistosoma japonicum]|uniref:U3 small nucleolar RNA-associated protein 25 homolog n=1 Tax=Schistosoma japonicum TaxID=6182 RepID=A0A4Z2CUQ5_SCHJA|nr:Digestive organ expansion factor [Schistosoma japonicum]
MEETVNAPPKESSFIRHFTVPYEQVKDQSYPEVTIAVNPYIGWYKSSADHKVFPFLNAKNPIEPNVKTEDAMLHKMFTNYEDVFYCRRTPENESVRLLYCSHALNHSLLCRALVSKNNEKEKQFGVSDSLRDQGFHRARTLILVPTREAARRIVHTFFQLMPKGSTVSHRRRFERDFGPQPGDTDKEKKTGRKPKDYEEWFSGNSNDNFRIGLAFSKKSVKLYSAFRDSDLILASPLGIKAIIDDEEEKQADVQYIIASIELLIIDQAEMLLMQNWATVQHIVSLLNQRPTVPVFASAARIRLCYLAGYGKRYRQTLLFSAVSTFLITLLSGECENFQGMNYIPPLSHYTDLYPTFLPDWVRIPGLKIPNRTGQKRQHSNIESVNEDKSTNYNFKLHLISFVVPGQISLKSSYGKLVNKDQSDSEDEMEVPPLKINDSLSSKELLKLDSSTNSLLLSRKSLTPTDYTYLSGRNVSMARLNAFKQRILPRLRRGTDPRVLIYVPDFYDLEELRQVLLSESLDFCCINEYTEDSEAERFRTLFGDGRIRILLITERYYFFRRRKIRGPQTFIFYGPPTFPWFVKELYDFRHSEGEIQYNMTILYCHPIETHIVAMITGSTEF